MIIFHIIKEYIYKKEGVFLLTLVVYSPFGNEHVNVLSQGHPKTLDPFFGLLYIHLGWGGRYQSTHDNKVGHREILLTRSGSNFAFYKNVVRKGFLLSAPQRKTWCLHHLLVLYLILGFLGVTPFPKIRFSQIKIMSGYWLQFLYHFYSPKSTLSSPGGFSGRIRKC